VAPRLVSQPPCVTGEMRDYQLEGLNWMLGACAAALVPRAVARVSARRPRQLARRPPAPQACTLTASTASSPTCVGRRRRSALPLPPLGLPTHPSLLSPRFPASFSPPPPSFACVLLRAGNGPGQDAADDFPAGVLAGEHGRGRAAPGARAQDDAGQLAEGDQAVVPVAAHAGVFGRPRHARGHCGGGAARGRGGGRAALGRVPGHVRGGRDRGGRAVQAAVGVPDHRRGAPHQERAQRAGARGARPRHVAPAADHGHAAAKQLARAVGAAQLFAARRLCVRRRL